MNLKQIFSVRDAVPSRFAFFSLLSMDKPRIHNQLCLIDFDIDHGYLGGFIKFPAQSSSGLLSYKPCMFLRNVDAALVFSNYPSKFKVCEHCQPIFIPNPSLYFWMCSHLLATMLSESIYGLAGGVLE